MRRRGDHHRYDLCDDLDLEPEVNPALRKGTKVWINYPGYEHDGRRGVIDLVEVLPFLGKSYRVPVCLGLEPVMYAARNLRVRHERDDFWRRAW